jgi:hypothetical protein
MVIEGMWEGGEGGALGMRWALVGVGRKMVD